MAADRSPARARGWHPVEAGRPHWLTIDYFDHHAPPDWRQRYGTDDPWRALQVVGRHPTAVVSVDIRQSTKVRRLLDSPFVFEGIVDHFFTAARDSLRGIGLWFDKFLGDGLLAHGPIWGRGEDGSVPLAVFLQVLGELSALFAADPVRLARQLLGDRIPPGFGLAIGIDAGLCRLWPMGGQPELQGDPLIVATRMQSAADAGEIVAAPHLGATIEHDRALALPPHMSFEPDIRYPKDHEDGVQVYVMRYLLTPRFAADGRLTGWVDHTGRMAEASGR
jgi:class 3 adenylate cyclase